MCVHFCTLHSPVQIPPQLPDVSRATDIRHTPLARPEIQIKDPFKSALQTTENNLPWAPPDTAATQF